MRVLMLVNSYPSVHSPSGATYITARVEQMRRHVDLDAVALVPQHTPALQWLRRLASRHPDAALRLHPAATAAFRECLVRWRPLALMEAHRGRLPDRLIDAVVGDVLENAQGSYDVVHAHGMYVLPAGEVGRRVADRLGCPFAVSLHGSDVGEVMPRFADTHARTLREAAATSYVSAALLERAVAWGAPRDGARVISNGVDRTIFHRRDVDADNGDALRLLFVGNLLPVKGADRLPTILDAVRRRHPGATLDVLGSGTAERHLAGLAGVRCHGRLAPAQVAEHMRAASVLVVPSRDEGWGCVASEAYACGTPVVATAVGGLRESVAPLGHVAEGHDAQLAEGFADAVDRVLAAAVPAEDGRYCRDWASVAADELAMLREVAG